MHDLAIAVTYRNKLARAILLTSSALFPLWAIIIPTWFCLFLLLLLRIPGAVPILPATVILTALLFTPLLALLATAIAEDDKITISQDGLSFPLLFLPQLRFRREFYWKDLTAMRVNWAGEAQLTSRDFLDLFFANRGHARIYLTKLSRTDLEQLVFALGHLATGRGEEEHLSQLQMHLSGGEAAEKRLSITKLWEEELVSRFTPTSFAPLLAGSFLQSGRLKIIKQLAFGGFSATYLAQRNERDLVVLKEAADHQLDNASSEGAATGLLRDEASILMRLKHPNIARVYDHFVENGRHYLLMQYVSGQNLRRLVMQNGPQPESSVISWAIDICKIFKYLHSQTPSIIHLDLTPENLMLRYDGQIFLIDFGSAKQIDNKASSHASGKQGYTAPEQRQLKPTPQSDVFALGSTLYYLLTGRDPETTITSESTLPSTISPQFARLLTACHLAELHRRIASASILETYLKELALGPSPASGDRGVNYDR